MKRDGPILRSRVCVAGSRSRHTHPSGRLATDSVDQGRNSKDSRDLHRFRHSSCVLRLVLRRDRRHVHRLARWHVRRHHVCGRWHREPSEQSLPRRSRTQASNEGQPPTGRPELRLVRAQGTGRRSQGGVGCQGDIAPTDREQTLFRIFRCAFARASLFSGKGKGLRKDAKELSPPTPICEL